MGCGDAHIFQYRANVSAGRKRTQPTLRHEVLGINEIRNSEAGAPSLTSCKVSFTLSAGHAGSFLAGGHFCWRQLPGTFGTEK